jgi:hypothetical protein
MNSTIHVSFIPNDSTLIFDNLISGDELIEIEKVLFKYEYSFGKAETSSDKTHIKVILKFQKKSFSYSNSHCGKYFFLTN